MIALWTIGGDRRQDLTTLREDRGLATLLGYPLPASTTVRDSLEAFHVEDGPLWASGPETAIPRESAPLTGLGTPNRTVVAGLQRGTQETTATLDVDATLVESHKDTATVAYDGTRGHQSVIVVWEHQHGIHLDFIRPGKSVENSYIESFSGRLRDECLNVELFFSVADARRKLECWRQDYNVYRPHSALADRTPAEVGAAWTTGAPRGPPETGPPEQGSRMLVETLN